MSDFEKALALLLRTFYTFATEDGRKDTLSKSEVKKLLEREMPGIFSSNIDQKSLDKVFKDLDANADGEVDFREFMGLVACLALTLDEYFTKQYRR